MPYAVAKDGARLYFEEAGSGTPIVFVHEFAGDYASWEPQMRYFSRGHRCITYSARGYTPSDVPAAAAFTYQNFRNDVLAVLDHLELERAHLIGLSMGAYSSLQVGLNNPSRAMSLTLAGIGTGSESARMEEFRDSAQRNARDFETLGSPEVAKVYAKSPNRIPFKVKDPRGFEEFVEALARHDAQGSAHTQRGFQGSRPSIYTFEDELKRMMVPTLIICGDEDDACLQPSIFLKQVIPASGLTVFPKTGHILNLEEPALFNETVERFLALVDAGRWPPRDPASKRA